MVSGKAAQPNPNRPTPDFEQGFNLTTAEHAERIIEQSLKGMDLDWLDFYQLWACSSLETFERVTARGGFPDGPKRNQKNLPPLWSVHRKVP